ncbi:E3 ubiquitin-protein ligase [Hordeum vulgare]|nr:E3 ubiquitin-protein ligase [Hordeum vulgare]
MRMSLKLPIRESGNAGAAEASEKGVKMEADVVVVADEVLLDLNIVDGVVPPQPEPEVHNDSCNDSGDESNDHSSDDADDEDNLFYLTMSIARMRMARGGTRGKS